MRAFLTFLAVASLGALFYYQKNHESASTAVQPGASQTTTLKVSSAATARPVSEHDWMKRSLDRATEVRNQARAQTQQSQDP